MNAHVSIDQPELVSHRTATARANAWRGRCLNYFCRAERLISDELERASETEKLPLLLSQRLNRLTKGCDTSSARSHAIAAFEKLLNLRNAVAHGDGSIFIDAKGQWLLLLEYRSRTGLIERTIRETNAKALHIEIHKVVQRLEAHLKPNPRSSDPGGTPSA